MKDPLERALGELPHGFEFRFIDRLISLVPGVEGVGEYKLKGFEPYLKGHFPGSPLMPGVLMVESIAQLAGVVAQSKPAKRPMIGLKLAAIRGAKITGSVLPGETMTINAQVMTQLGNLIHASGTAHVGDRLVLKCEITLSGDAALNE